MTSFMITDINHEIIHEQTLSVYVGLYQLLWKVYVRQKVFLAFRKVTKILEQMIELGVVMRFTP